MSETNNTILTDEDIQKQAEEKLDPVEASAYFLHQAHIDFRRLGYALCEKKKRALVRVLEAVLFEPLEQIELLGANEQEMFALCQQIMYHKGVVLQFAMRRVDDKLQNKVQGDQANG